MTADLVKWSYSGVRPLYDDGASEAQAATRDYVLKLDARDGDPPLVTIFGGKITTYRRLAESALAMLARYLPAPRRAAGWTAREPLPGGEFPVDGFEDEVRRTNARYPFLDQATARRLVRAYGARAGAVLGEAKSNADLGRRFGAGLTEAEVRYLVRQEWARAAEDVVWRRSKLGLRLSSVEIAEINSFLRSHATVASGGSMTRGRLRA